MLTMPRLKGKTNYKVDVLFLVVKEKLPNGAQAWQEVAALYQHWNGEMVLWDHDDVKRHWVDKCCNKFKKPMGDPGDPKRWSQEGHDPEMPADLAADPHGISIRYGQTLFTAWRDDPFPAAAPFP
jgi:hypothetical protein